MENRTVLNERNYHRAATVRLIEDPEAGEWNWGFHEHKERRGLGCDFHNKATKGEDVRIVKSYDIELNKWEVASWKYQESLEDLYPKAYDAHSASSFDPERRALEDIRGYEEMLLNDLKMLPESEWSEYREKFRSMLCDVFSKGSRCMSAAITGPANFPTSRNNRAWNAYDAALENFSSWRERYKKSAMRRIEAAKPAEQKADEEWKRVKREIDEIVSSLYDIDVRRAPYSRPLFVSSLFGKLERIAQHGKSELIAKATEYVRDRNEWLKSNGAKVIFTPRHKFWQLAQQCQASIQKEAERADMENVEIPFDGGYVVKNYADDRLQIFHDEKPDRDVIYNLKSNGFRWSPSNGCWQRQLTNNAYYAAARVVPLTVAEILDTKHTVEA